MLFSIRQLIKEDTVALNKKDTQLLIVVKKNRPVLTTSLCVQLSQRFMNKAKHISDSHSAVGVLTKTTTM